MADEFEDLIDRLLASVGEAVYEDPPCASHPPASGESWVDLQPLVVAAASQGPASPEPLAHALLEAVLHSPAFGPQNRLTAEAFAFMLAAVPEELAISIRTSADPFGGQRWLQEHVWQIPGPDGARWLRTLAEADDVRANFLYQDMRSGRVAMWVDEDWPDRLDALVRLPAKPRPGIITMLPIIPVPRVAGPALVRLLMAHGVDERDWLVRQSAANLRGLRRPDPADDVELVDWDQCRSRPELFRWVLELMGEPGDRSGLVTAAVRAGAVSAREADWLAAPVDRPAWADGEVPWEVDAVVMAGEVIVPSGRLTGDDPWSMVGGLPWTIMVPPGRYPVHVIIGVHPLAGRECAALHLVIDPTAVVERWALVPDGRFAGKPGYDVEVGVAGLGALEAYGGVFESEHADFPGTASPAWRILDGGPAGTAVLCTVGPQHQTCRTWLGTTGSGGPAAVVTDLGLLGIDLETEPVLPWT